MDVLECNMALSKEDIQIIKRIVSTNVQENMDILNRYMQGKPYILNITYDELQEEIVKIRESVPDIPIVRLE
jgi:hypothetical protein